MCLYIPIAAEPVTLSKPLRVYKLLYNDNCSFFRHFKYEKNKKVSAEIIKTKPEDTTFSVPLRLCPEGFMHLPPCMDNIEHTELCLWIINNSLQYKEETYQPPRYMKINSILQIDSGLHFFYTLDRLGDYLKDSWQSAERIGEFEIPAESIVYTGIDTSLGVTDNIILKRTFTLKDV